MFGLFGLFGDKTEKEARRLNRDAPEIIAYSRRSLRPETVRDVALLTAEHLERAHNIFEPNAVGLKRAILEYKRLHQEAVRHRDDAALSAFTLVQIYVRAEALGDAARPAVDAIDDFIAEWEHARE